MKESEDKRGLRSFVLDRVSEQFNAGNSAISVDPIIAAVLADDTMRGLAVGYAVKNIVGSRVNSLIRGDRFHGETAVSERGGASRRLIAAVTDYGLSLLDVHFGAKCLGDYLPHEAVTYASQQHGAARKMAIQARFMVGVANACKDATKAVREQLTNEQVEVIRQAIITTSPNMEAAEIALAVA